MSMPLVKKLILAIFLLSVIFVFNAWGSDPRIGETKANVNLREGPSTQDTIIKTVPKGSKITFLKSKKSRNNWHYIQAGNDKGWLYGTYVKALKPAGKKQTQSQSTNTISAKSKKNISSIPSVLSYLHFLCWIMAFMFFMVFLVAEEPGKKRILLALAFVSMGVGFFSLQFRSGTSTSKEGTFWKQRERAYWEYEVDCDNPMPVFHCDANVPYTIETNGRPRGIELNRRMHRISLRHGSHFNLTFKNPTSIKLINWQANCLYIQGTVVEIWKGKTEGKKFLILDTNSYSDFSVNVVPGQKIDFLRQADFFYVGHFQNDEFLYNTLIRNDDEYFIRFDDSYKLRFKAAEVPFLFYLKDLPKTERLQVDQKDFGNALYMKKGDIADVNIWLDAGDQVCFDRGGYNGKGHWIKDKIALSTGNGSWGSVGFIHNELQRQYKANRAGYLKIKCLTDNLTINFMSIRRRHSWTLNLKPGETKKIKFWAGDKIRSESKTRFYLNGSMTERGKYYTNSFSHDGFIEFKGSIDNSPIKVSVLARKGI